MSTLLPTNVRKLLYMESVRVELKATWDEKTTGLQVLHTLCAFANDFQNLNGGYVVIGIDAPHGCAVPAPAGLDPNTIESIQRWVRGRCNTLDPVYQPVMSPECIDGKHVLVLWAPASEVRVHFAPRTFDRGAPRCPYIRLGPETVEARGDTMTRLLQLTAKVPFDDRRAQDVPVQKLREGRVREFLSDIGSGLTEEPDSREIYRRMGIVSRVNGHEVPRNVGLLFFADDPEEWFRGARIEVVQFAGGVSGDVLEERIFRGPLHHQLRDAISYLHSFSTQHLQKLSDRPEVKGWVSYPLPAMEEALVNAVYHRSYEGEPEPIKVYLYPNRMEIISYPGPVPGIEPHHLTRDGRTPVVPLRNRRVGEFLKDLRLAEGRGTGIPKVFRAMAQNGSPSPEFDFDEGRSYFRVTLPAHPEYMAISALRDAAHLQAIGSREDALERLAKAHGEFPGSETLAGALIREWARFGHLHKAEEVFGKFMENSGHPGGERAILAMAGVLLDAGQGKEATKILDRLPALLTPSAAFDAAIAERRAKRQELAHRYFERAGDEVYKDVRALHEFAQTKINLAGKLHRARKGGPFQRDTKKRLLREAHGMLERVLQMDAPATRRAWAWYDLGRILNWSRASKTDVERAFLNATELLSDEPRFQEALERIQSKGSI